MPLIMIPTMRWDSTTGILSMDPLIHGMGRLVASGDTEDVVEIVVV